MNIQKKVLLDAGPTIVVKDEYGLAHWSKRFGVTKDQLKAAVREAGPSADAVRQHLELRAK
jgi:Protein of unknown function (DUF3606)